MSSVFFISLIYHEDILPSCPSSSSTSECVLVHDSSIVSVTPFCHYHEYTLPSCHSFSSTSECVLIHDSLLILYLVLLNVINTLSVQLIYFSCLTPSLSVGGGMLWFPPTTFTYLHEFVHTHLHSHICPTDFYVMWLCRCIHTRMIAHRHLTLWHATSAISHCSLTQSL